jgi:hypothetical protein
MGVRPGVSFDQRDLRRRPPKTAAAPDTTAEGTKASFAGKLFMLLAVLVMALVTWAEVSIFRSDGTVIVALFTGNVMAVVLFVSILRALSRIGS